jgi:hypothetical protein
MAAVPEENDKERIIRFLDNVRSDLELAVSNVGLLVLDEELNWLIVKVWKEMAPKFETAKSQLSEKDLGYLQGRGLVEFELDLKLAVYERERKRFREWFERERRREEPWRKCFRLRIRRGFWDIVDSILDSIGLPGTDAIKEFKESLKIASGG